MRSVDRVVVFEKIRALEERLDDIDNRLDTLFSSFYCSSESSSSESDYEPCKPTASEKSGNKMKRKRYPPRSVNVKSTKY